MSDKNEIVAFSFENASASLVACYERISESLPKDFNIERAAQNALTVLNAHPEYRKFGPGKLWECFRQSAIMNLDIGMGEGYIVPYGNDLQFMPSYRGDKLTIMRYSVRKVRDVHAYLVHEGDMFEATQHTDSWEWTFKPKPFSKDKMIGAFAYVTFEDGGNRLEMMNAEELEAARKQSKASNSPAWNKFSGEMYRKVILHRVCKHIDIDLNAEQRNIMLNGINIETDPKGLRDMDVAETATEVFDVDGVVYDA